MMIHLCPLETVIIAGILGTQAPAVSSIRAAYRRLAVSMPKPPDLVADDLARWQAYQLMREPDSAKRAWSMAKLYAQLLLLGAGLTLGLAGLLLLLVK